MERIRLNVKEKSRGNHQGQLRITKRGSSEARRYRYRATLRTIRSDPIFGAWHHKKIQRDGGIKLKSVVALMRKDRGGLWHVPRGNRFDSRRLFDLTKLKSP